MSSLCGTGATLAADPPAEDYFYHLRRQNVRLLRRKSQRLMGEKFIRVSATTPSSLSDEAHLSAGGQERQLSDV
jgi:hypothetical protein